MMDGKALSTLLVTALVLSLLVLAPELAALRPVDVDTGYAPVQPIAFSHRLHAGELEIACLYCHFGAERSRRADIPPLSVCMNCHRKVSAPFLEARAEAEAAEKDKRAPRRVVSPELAKVYAALGLDASLKPDPRLKPRPVAWNRVYDLPDFVWFDHRPHLAAGVECQRCHGPVETMERVLQVPSLTMGWCVNCHRSTPARAASGAVQRPPRDCSTCHF